MHTRRSIVSIRQPFDFSLSLEFLGGFSPMVGEQKTFGDTLEKAWIVREQPMTTVVRQDGDGLVCSITSPKPIDDARDAELRTRVGRFVSADENLTEFYAIAERDRAFAPIAERLRGLHHPKFPSAFEAACWGLVNQRIQLTQARKIKAAIVARWGAKGFDAFPEAATLARVTEKDLQRVMGGNERKARAVGAAARAFAKIDDNWLHTAPITEVEAWLRGIYGVGDFTAGFVAFRGLGRAISLPWSPKFVVAAQQTYGRTCDRAALEKRAGSYGPWLGHWSLYLWAATFIRTERAA